MTTRFAETTKRRRNDRGAPFGGRARRADSPHAEASAGKEITKEKRQLMAIETPIAAHRAPR